MDLQNLDEQIDSNNMSTLNKLTRWHHFKSKKSKYINVLKTSLVNLDKEQNDNLIKIQLQGIWMI